MKKFIILVGLVMALFMLSCTSKRVTQLNTTSAMNLSPHNRRVFVTPDTFPPATYIAIENIEIKRRWFGGGRNIYAILANQARIAGADAVIQASTGQAFNVISAVGPYGSGMAVKLVDNVVIDYSKLRGGWY